MFGSSPLQGRRGFWLMIADEIPVKTNTKALLAALFISFPSFAWGYDLAGHVTEFKLPNGMRWLLVRRTQAPVFSGVVAVRVGGADEVEGKTGLAHMFEHMAFNGSGRIGTRNFAKEKPILDEIELVGAELTTEEQKRNEPKVRELKDRLKKLEKEADSFQVKNEIWQVLSRNGAADLNAYTSKDSTFYIASMPSDRLELWAQVTAEMVFEPVFREFYTERNVVAEERRSSVENDPDGTMQEEILKAAFADGPYHWSTIGFEKDIMGLTIADARQFHNRHYVPGNMVGILVGDLNIAQAKEAIRRSFGRYAHRPVPPGPKGPGTAKGGVVYKFSFDAQPSLAVAYHKPTLPDTREYVFDVIDALLCEGRSSRLYRRLVNEKKVAEAIYCTVGFPGSRLSNLFMIWIEPLRPHTPAEVLKEVASELASLKDEEVSNMELSRIRKQVTAGLVFALDRNMSLAQQLADFETTFGDWRLLAEYPKRIKEVSTQDVLEVARKYFQDDNRVVVERTRGRR